MYTSTKKVETITPSIDTTPPVETPQTTPHPDDESTTDEKSENIYHDKYFTVTLYLSVVSIYFFTISSYLLLNDDDEQTDYFGSIFMVLSMCILCLSFIMSIVSLSVDSLHTEQLVLMILYVVNFPLSIVFVWKLYEKTFANDD